MRRRRRGAEPRLPLRSRGFRHLSPRSSYDLGKGAFLPSYSSELRHLYLRGDPGLAIAILGVEHGGALTVLEKIDAVDKAHCLVADDRRHVWTCDWKKGALLRLDDATAATAP